MGFDYLILYSLRNIERDVPHFYATVKFCLSRRPRRTRVPAFRKVITEEGALIITRPGTTLLYTSCMHNFTSELLHTAPRRSRPYKNGLLSSHTSARFLFSFQERFVIVQNSSSNSEAFSEKIRSRKRERRALPKIQKKQNRLLYPYRRRREKKRALKKRSHPSPPCANELKVLYGRRRGLLSTVTP